MKRFAKAMYAAGVLGGLLAGVQTLTAAPSNAQQRACELVWSWQQQMWVCADGPP